MADGWPQGRLVTCHCHRHNAPRAAATAPKNNKQTMSHRKRKRSSLWQRIRWTESQLKRYYYCKCWRVNVSKCRPRITKESKTNQRGSFWTPRLCINKFRNTYYDCFVRRVFKMIWIESELNHLDKITCSIPWFWYDYLSFCALLYIRV